MKYIYLVSVRRYPDGTNLAAVHIVRDYTNLAGFGQDEESTLLILKLFRNKQSMYDYANQLNDGFKRTGTFHY